MPDGICPLPGHIAAGTIALTLHSLFDGGLIVMEKPDAKKYEQPKVLASLDALEMITDADGMAVGACGSRCAAFK